MAKSAKKAGTQRGTATDRSGDKRAAPPAAVSDSDIARLAHERHCLRGGQHGHDVDDWLEAERELRGALKPAGKRRD